MRNRVPSLVGFAVGSLLVILNVTPAAAQSTGRDPRFAPQFLGAPLTPPAPTRDRRFEPQFAGAHDLIETKVSRPRILLGLYGSLAAVNVLDLVSTQAALGHGATELNPAMRGSVGQQIGVKTAMTLGSIAVAERLWKKNKVAAIATLVAANGALAVISAHNFHNASLAR